jgi:hypothetical protein
MNNLSTAPDRQVDYAPVLCCPFESGLESQTAFQFAFQSVSEREHEFLSLFPHRFDYIWANHPQPQESVAWQTERRHPLSDRAILQGEKLYGVRFGSTTRYVMLDIDAGSAYHPTQDSLAIPRLAATLEPLGLVSYFAVTSSASGGLHLYFPFTSEQKSWQVAIAVAHLLETTGYGIQPGQLELFPNPKSFIPGGTPSLYNAHRLPLQLGSYLLDRDLEPIGYSQAGFVQAWKFAAVRNEFDTIALAQLVKAAKRRLIHLSGKADKFLNDLNTEIELGWTGSGQTNRLLGRIALRGYVFYHIIQAGLPLIGQALVDHIVETARSLPGYFDWCQHQHEILDRAIEWARCVESSHYFPYNCSKKTSRQKGRSRSDQTSDRPSDQALDQTSDRPSDQRVIWNQKQLESARERIWNAIADLLNQNALPSQVTERFNRLTAYGIGGSSLYRHKDLWHPDYLNTPNPIDLSPTEPQNTCDPCTSLLDDNGRNLLSVEDCDILEAENSNAGSEPGSGAKPVSAGAIGETSQGEVGDAENCVRDLPCHHGSIAAFRLCSTLCDSTDQSSRFGCAQRSVANSVANSLNPMTNHCCDRKSESCQTQETARGIFHLWERP